MNNRIVLAFFMSQKRIMVVDGGSTKCHWLVFGAGPDVEFTSGGVNPLMVQASQLTAEWEALFRGREVGRVDEVAYYGAGCIGGPANEKVARALEGVTGCGAVTVESDIVGAARATLGHEEGIACILGTGCNSCLYDGRMVVANVPPLGYILGDEGSGADIGRAVVAAALKGLLNERLTREFWEFAGEDYRSIISRIYSQPRANAYLANFARFAVSHLDDESVEALVLRRLGEFLSRNVMLYDRAQGLPVGFVGGVAKSFEPLLRRACEAKGVSVKVVVADPTEGIRRFHEG